MRQTLLCFLFTAGLCWAQEQTAGEAGVTPEWDVKAQMSAMREDVNRIGPLLKQLKPAEWSQKAASGTYAKQMQSSAVSLQNLVAATDRLANDPHRLTLALEAFFRMEKMETLLVSLADGVRRYQSGDLADELNTLLASNMVHRDRLRQHVTDLASAREQDLELVSQEAQRCRGSLSKPAAPPVSDGRKNRIREGK